MTIELGVGKRQYRGRSEYFFTRTILHTDYGISVFRFLLHFKETHIISCKWNKQVFKIYSKNEVELFTEATLRDKALAF